MSAIWDREEAGENSPDVPAAGVELRVCISPTPYVLFYLYELCLVEFTSGGNVGILIDAANYSPARG